MPMATRPPLHTLILGVFFVASALFTIFSNHTIAHNARWLHATPQGTDAGTSRRKHHGEYWRVRTIAGNQQPDYADGIGMEAKLTLPHGICYGPSGLVFADTLTHTIRQIAPNGEVSLVAGTPLKASNKDGPGIKAGFKFPEGVAQDARGSIYVADAGNHLIRKITPYGKVSTFAGGLIKKGGFEDGPSLSSAFQKPFGVAVVDDIVYVTDTQNMCIRKIRGGQVTYFAGGFGGTTWASEDGMGTEATFVCPRGIAADRKAIYVCDPPIYPESPEANEHHFTPELPHVVRKITPNGEVTRLAGGLCGDADGKALEARFSTPTGIALGPSGHLYLTDTMNHKIRRISPGGRVVTLMGTGTGLHRDGLGIDAMLNAPHALAVNPERGEIYIADTFSSTIRAGVHISNDRGGDNLDTRYEEYGTGLDKGMPMGDTV